uniref:Uncharacterized protein n=1 Tax=Setaria italica TaxID=4555 RepID=K3ZYI3_SETIT
MAASSSSLPLLRASCCCGVQIRMRTRLRDPQSSPPQPMRYRQNLCMYSLRKSMNGTLDLICIFFWLVRDVYFLFFISFSESKDSFPTFY